MNTFSYIYRLRPNPPTSLFPPLFANFPLRYACLFTCWLCPALGRALIPVVHSRSLTKSTKWLSYYEMVRNFGCHTVFSDGTEQKATPTPRNVLYQKYFLPIKSFILEVSLRNKPYLNAGFFSTAIKNKP